MTTLSFDAGYATFQSDSALLGRRFDTMVVTSLRRLAGSPQVEAGTAVAARAALAMLPFSAIVWLFVAR